MHIQEPPIDLQTPREGAVYFATVIAGLEAIAAEELAEKLPGARVVALLRGKLVFEWPHHPAAGLALRTIEHLFALAGQIEDIPPSAEGLDTIERAMAALELEAVLALHAQMHGARAAPSFRITAARSGYHDYNSMEIAAAAGAGVVRRYGWRVDLEHYDYDVRVYVTDRTALVGLRLSDEPLHKRARVRHGAASLNPTVAHAMCRLAQPAGDQVFVDPMCGAGTILIERAGMEKAALLIGGDLFAEPLEAARTNLLAAAIKAELLQWDARELPLAAASVDAVVCNLPWGRRIGSHRVNQHLYPGFVRELARVLAPGGRAVLLTQEKRLLSRLVERSRHLELVRQYQLSLAGTHPAIYVLAR